MTKRGKQASRKAAARKYGFLEVPILSATRSGSQDVLTKPLEPLMDTNAR
ncbi:MAG: hypothetical protein Q8K59_09080 [Nitrosomonas sp.]|nr:hypothetical protein [Nitrosomonas sp.]MDP1951228.1 hypothetical protein [Nitrosomonas sp.]